MPVFKYILMLWFDCDQMRQKFTVTRQNQPIHEMSSSTQISMSLIARRKVTTSV